MSQEILIFEDVGWKRLYPITLSRPTFECRVGVTTLARRLVAQLSRRDIKKAGFLCRPLLRPLVERDYPGHAVNQEKEGDVLFLNGRLLCLGEAVNDFIPLLDKAAAVQQHGELVAARVTGSAAADFARELREALEAGEPAPFPAGHALAPGPEGVRLAVHLWDLMAWNSEVLEDDLHLIHHPHCNPELAPGAQTLHRDHILCREGVKVEAGAILDAGPGPIFLGEGAHVQHNAVVLGPAHVGPNSVVKLGAKLEGSVSLGPLSKVGGEIESCIVQGYTNKQHDGFLGHSYLGSWVNLGAGTNNSDLKNNYSTVRVWTPHGVVDTNQQFVGLFMGDHSKTAIGTQFNTGTVVGFSCNVFGAGFPPKHMPSFSWGGAEGIEPYDLARAEEVARLVRARRNVANEPADEVLFRSIHSEAPELEGGGELGGPS
jgi:UDP-N-acetylglucosamine diphosphorylase/glucosamine-1-phosphate N-acetyltransferase